MEEEQVSPQAHVTHDGGFKHCPICEMVADGYPEDVAIEAMEGMTRAWPQTPEEREAIPEYGDLVSTVIWYPEYVVRCRNCDGTFGDHDPETGACTDLPQHRE